ncbi:hypothetical protein CTAM01_10130 [Colletotrichum tamarilloi]|uniref:Rhodopsin domain-containing protein n=1 Tax=Colletotrichum tamarilloi TaxID=1209934 RepID=A0ABQ9R1F4_9PEZI|nr:uncharacterized protein CTAM01_10130 [Colletotrichum tamarilloi]KAK1492073.1 hypothetical protein CTAM01_10130 [Colletotrichum tamarilloi]
MSAPPLPTDGSVPLTPEGDAPQAQTDFVYSDSQANATIAFGAIITIITTASVIARLYTRYFITKQVRIDDAWALLALFSTIAVNIMQSVFTKVYLPTMLAMVTASNEGSKIPYAVGITYNIAMAALKMTFLFQFYHIFRNVRIMRRVYVGAIIFVAAWTLAQILLQILICLPIEANWDHSVRNAKCLPSVLSTYFNATGTLVTDVIVLFLPLPTLWSLKLNSSQRWAALGVFGIGALVPIMSAGRIWSLTHAPPKGYMSTACWTIAELGVGVTTASLATIRQLLDRKVNELFQRHQEMARRQSAMVTVGSQTNTAQQFNTRSNGSEVDLIHGRWPHTGTNSALSNHGSPRSTSSLSKVFEVFTKEKFLRSSTGGSQGDQSGLNLQNGATSTMVTTSRNHSISMSEGAANFLGEFGILVERTWEVEEIRME